MQALLDSGSRKLIAGQLIWTTLEAGNKILLCGNGGSAADAQQIAAELVGRYEAERRSFPAVALTTDTSRSRLKQRLWLRGSFARQVQALGSKGDLLIAISTSGKSPNVINAADKARALGLKTIALAGCSGEPLASHGDLAVSFRLTERREFRRHI